MRKKIMPLLVFLSVALNLAFVVVWAARALPTHLAGHHGPSHEEGIWCPLHRRLGTTEAQWREIEPRAAEFQKSAQAVSAEINCARAEMIDLIAAPEPDRHAIRAKQEEIVARQRQMQELVIDHLLSEKNFLTHEQQQQLFRMMRQQSGCAGHGPMTGRGPVQPAGEAGDGKAARQLFPAGG